MTKGLKLGTIAALLGLVLVPDAARAQGQIEEIVVTSQKRAEGVSVQDLSGAVTAVDESLIDNTFSVDLVDVGRLVPNATLHPSATFAATPNFFIRGIGVSGTTRSLDPAVGVFVDGMYLGYPVGATVDTFDREIIEVLRGPQGTLLGRNVTGGAIVVRSKRPSGEFGFDAEAVIGNFNRMDLSASVEGPLMEDKVAAKIAVMSRRRDGFWEDNNGGSVDLAINPAGLPNSSTGTKPDVDNLIVRPMIMFTPSDTVDITFIAEYMRDQGGTANSRSIPNAATPRVTESVFGYVPPSDPYEIDHDFFGYTDLETKHLIGELNWDMGHGELTAISSWRDLTFDSSTDFDGSPFVVFHFPDNKEEQDQVSQEIRYASTFSDSYEFVAGLFYYEQNFVVGERRNILGNESAIVADVTQDTASIFSEANFFLTDNWTLTVGGRWTTESKEVAFGPLGTCELDFSSCTPTLNRDGSWNDFTPKIAAKYQIDDQSMVYGSWTEGFRSGTFDARARTVDSFLNSSPSPESVQAFEFGYKLLTNDGRLRFNATAFYNDYTDIQRLALEPVPISVDPEGRIQRLINGAEATISGLELELSFIPVDNLTIDASLGYVDAGYDRFDGFDADGVPGFDPVTDPAAAKALKFERVPELTWYLAGTYFVPMADNGELDFRVSYSWSDEYYNDALNAEIIKQDSYGLVDASASWTSADSKWEVSLFARNLFEEDYFEFGLDNPLTTLTWGGMPRTFGLRASYAY
ncbi:MAG: TonB-dependent receptor [Pseudomonadota bacterium]